MIIKYPANNLQRGIIEKRVSLVDLFPTILDLRIFPILPGLMEKSYHPDHPIIAESYRHCFSTGKYRRDLKAIYQGKEKYIWASNSQHEFYDLEQDPGETINLFKKFPQKAQRMEQIIKQWLSSFKPPATSESKAQRMRERLPHPRVCGLIEPKSVRFLGHNV